MAKNTAQILGFVAALVTICLIGRKVSLGRKNSKGIPQPPGPKGFPIIGNMFDMPEKEPWEWAAEQARKYGDMVFVNVLGHPMLFLNSYSTAVDLLETRSANSSSRPRLIFANELQGWDWYPAFMPYGPRFRKHQAFMHQFLESSAVPAYIPLQMREVHVLLNGLLSTPQNYDKHIRRYPGATILNIIYGHEVKSENDPFVALAEEGISTAAAAETMYPVEFLPWLKYLPEWFPGMGFKRLAREGRTIADALLRVPYAEAKKNIMEGTASPSALSRLIADNMNENGNIEDEDVIAGSMAIMYAGGQDTITNVLMIVILAMVLHPEVQRKAQEELDLVVGRDTLPTYGDRENLPYINAIWAEALRWKVLLPLAVGHCIQAEEIYNGYRIPVGTTIFPNVWSISKNPTEYPDPEEFKPERWLGKNPPVHSDNYAFGFGRRSCPGKYLAENALFIAISSMLAAFNFNKARDTNGKIIEPEVIMSTSFTRSLARFDCTVTPRSSSVASLVRQIDMQN